MTLNVQLQLTPETIEKLRQRASQHGEDLDVYISKLVAEEGQADSELRHRVGRKPRDLGEWSRA
ncbi:MAG: hypothetical protein JNM43_21220 [Planctomycetaceae bacterium]|nr:hypothetical protein [Planctomycetaceae bacterium]